MTRKIGAGAFLAHCLGLLDEVEQQRNDIVIPNGGRPVAWLVPIGDDAPEIFGRFKGSGRINGDIYSSGESWEADAW